MKVVIVGGVAGGASAAARLRRLDEKAEIVVFERSGYISYANCGLPYYMGGEIKDEASLTLQTPESFYERYRVKMHVRHEVVAINSKRKIVRVKNLDTGEKFEESYDKLILATGAMPRTPDVKGLNNKRVFTVRTIEDIQKLKKHVTENMTKDNQKDAMVLGGGAVGIEVTENLYKQGIHVTLYDTAEQVMPAFDKDMAAFIQKAVRKNGVRIVLAFPQVTRFGDSYGNTEVEYVDRHYLREDLVVLAMGVTPDTKLAEKAGLELGIKGSIIVNDRMETSEKDIYAVGDAVQVKNFITGEDTLYSLAGPANKQGRVAADNICGLDSHYKYGQGTSIVKVFDRTAAITGINERDAKAAGFDVDKIILSPMNHASYYPAAKPMTIKIIFEKETYRLLGAQIVGFEGVDKRIDVLSTAIRANMKVTDLVDLDLAYAPPYSSAKDPIIMAGFIAENLKRGIVKQWYLEDLDSLPRDGSVTLLDTRTVKEYKDGHIEGFINIPVDELRYRIDELKKDKPVYIICRSGFRSYLAARILEGHGFECYNFAGGYLYYEVNEEESYFLERFRGNKF